MPSAAHLHASRIDDRAIELLAQGRERPSVALPPLGDLLGMLAWSLVPAVPLLALVDWQAAAVVGGAGLLVRAIRRRGGRPEATFANGFLQFQGDGGRARGVQEDDDVRWRWAGRGGDERAGGWRPLVVARIDQPLTAPPVMPRTKYR